MTRLMMIFCIMFFAEAVSVRAQTSPFQVGIQGGASIANIVGSGAQGSSSRTSPYFGGILVVHKSHSAIGFETGVLYVPKGATTSFQGAKYALEINYIEIPLLLRLGLPLQGSQVMPVFTLGASVGIKSACKLASSSGSASFGVGCDDSAFQGQFDLKPVDFGLSGGGELDVPVGERLLFAPSVRYTRGLSVIGNTPYNADATNSAFQIGVSLRARF